jgi:hypothetical protein
MKEEERLSDYLPPPVGDRDWSELTRFPRLRDPNQTIYEPTLGKPTMEKHIVEDEIKITKDGGFIRDAPLQ